ncbi:MAG: pitrilysin family protein [Bdellovibrionota bacterium]
MSGPEKKEILPLAGDYRVHRYRFDNGLKLLVVEDHSSPTFSYQTWYNVGSRHEKIGRTGLAHLFEHMMFKQTKNLKDGEFSKKLDELGAQGENAFTTQDYTAYIQELPVNSASSDHESNLELITRFEAERMTQLVVDEKAFKTETEVVQNERRFRYENNADGAIYQELFDLSFNKHPYHWPVIGYQQDLDAMSSDNAVDFYRNYYNPSRTVIAVSGDVIPDEVSNFVKKHYGSLLGSSPPSAQYEQEPPQTAPRRKALPLNVQVEKLAMSYHIPGILQEDVPTLSVIEAILSGGKSSRLHRALVDTGVASAIEIYDGETVDPGLFSFFVNFQKGKRATMGESIILKELEELKKKPVPDPELEKAKNRIRFTYFQDLESNYRKTHFIGLYETIAGDFTFGPRMIEQIGQITPAQVQAVAKKYFDPSGRTVVTGVPK